MIFDLVLAASAAASCSFQNAHEVQPYELMADPEAWIDECVQLNGYVSGYSFFADVAGNYRFRASDRIYDPNQGWLGLYFDERSDSEGRLRHASVVGRVNTCERSYEAASSAADEGIIIMMIGYCHYRGGLTLDSVRMRAGSEVQFERQIGDENRRSFGDLTHQVSPSELPVEIQDLFDRFFAVLGSRDAALMGQIVNGWSLAEEELDSQAVARYLSGRDGSPFSAVREAGAGLQIAYFLERNDPVSTESETDQLWVGCFCVENDCRGRWPISTFDATAVAGKPYVCLRAYFEDYHADGQRITGWKLTADVSGETLLASPD